MITITIDLDGIKTTRPLDGKQIVIGRSRSADIRIDHPKVSGKHARIEVAEDGSAQVIDAGSRNGLMVADGKVDRVAVTDGLAVTIGPALFTFSTGGGQARAESLQRLQLPDPGVSGISPPPAPGSGLGTTPRDAVAGALQALSEPRRNAEGASATRVEGSEGARAPESNGPSVDSPTSASGPISTPRPALPHSPAAALLAEIAKQAALPPSPPAPLEIAAAPAPSAFAPHTSAPSRRAVLSARDRRFSARSILHALTASGALVLSLGLHGFIALLLTVCVYRQYTAPAPAPIRLSFEAPKSIFVPPADPWVGDGKGVPDGSMNPKFAPRPEAPAPDESLAEPELPVEGATLADPETAASKRASSAPRPVMALSKKSASRKLVKVELVPDDGSWESGNVAAAGVPAVKPKPPDKANPPVDIQPGDEPADLVRGNLENGQQGGWKTVATMEANEIAVVTGDYDTVQRVLDKLKVRYTTIEPKKFGGARLGSVKVLILNCPGNLDGSGILKLRSFVDKGGWVVSTDWALAPIKEAFPGYLRNVGLSPETWVGISAAEGAKDDPLLKDVFNFTGEAPKWYLEERSYLFKVDDKAKEKVRVLIESAEMKKKYNTDCVAATFDYGRGKVLHIVSHLQQVSTDPKAHYAMYQFLANWLIQAAASRPVEEAKK